MPGEPVRPSALVMMALGLESARATAPAGPVVDVLEALLAGRSPWPLVRPGGWSRDQVGDVIGGLHLMGLALLGDGDDFRLLPPLSNLVEAAGSSGGTSKDEQDEVHTLACEPVASTLGVG